MDVEGCQKEIDPLMTAQSKLQETKQSGQIEDVAEIKSSSSTRGNDEDQKDETKNLHEPNTLLSNCTSNSGNANTETENSLKEEIISENNERLSPESSRITKNGMGKVSESGFLDNDSNSSSPMTNRINLNFQRYESELSNVSHSSIKNTSASFETSSHVNESRKFSVSSATSRSTDTRRLMFYKQPKGLLFNHRKNRNQKSIDNQPTKLPKNPDQSESSLQTSRGQYSLNEKKLEEVAADCPTIPNWLIYSWTSANQGKNKVGSVRYSMVGGVKNRSPMKDRRARAALCEILILKQYLYPSALALSVPTSQHESISRSLLAIFGSINDILIGNRFLTPSLGLPDTGANPREPNQKMGESTGNNSSEILDSHKKLTLSKSGIRLKDHTVGFMDAMIAEEVEDAKSESTLFRSNNAISKLLSLYANANGQNYLKAMLESVLEEVIKLEDVEVDPAKLNPDYRTTEIDDLPSELSDNIQKNMNKLLEVTQKVLDAVCNSAGQCPLPIRKLCYLIQRQVDLKFLRLTTSPSSESSKQPNSPVSTRKEQTEEADSKSPPNNESNRFSFNQGNGRTKQAAAVSGFIFLRFICPAIVTPEKHGLLNKPVTSKQRRTLILVSKVLQNLANGVRFGNKERYMTSANPFIEKNEGKLVLFLNELQHVDTQKVFWLCKNTKDCIRYTGIDLDVAFNNVVNLTSQFLEQLNDKIGHSLINEMMNYTVFGALKYVIKRFETMESNAVSPQVVVENSVLLGSLEEVLLLNDKVLIRAMLYPSNFMKGCNHLIGNIINVDTFDDDPSKLQKAYQRLNEEMDTIARSAVQVLGPHGEIQLAELVIWLFEKEIEIRSLNANGDPKKFLEKIIEGPSAVNSKDLAIIKSNIDFGTSIAFKVFVSFAFSHTKNYIVAPLRDSIKEIWHSGLDFEIDAERVDSDEKLQQNLENLTQVSLKIFDLISQSWSSFPRSMVEIFVYLYNRLKNPELAQGVLDLDAVKILSDFLFNRYLCVIIRTPNLYGLIKEEKNEKSARIFTLISYLLTYFSRKAFAKETADGETSTLRAQTGKILLDEKEYLEPILTKWKDGMKAFFQKVLSHEVSLPATNISTLSLSESTASAAVDGQVPGSEKTVKISVTSRARGIYVFRKLINSISITRMKSLIDTSTHNEDSKSNSLVKIAENDGRISSKNGNELEKLNGLRVENLQYKLLDRILVFVTSINEKESQNSSKTATLKVRRESRTASMNKEQYTEKSMAKKEVTIPEENNNQHISNSLSKSSSKLTSGGKNKWTNNAILMATRRIVSRIFSSIRSTGSMDSKSRQKNALDPTDESIDITKQIQSDKSRKAFDETKRPTRGNSKRGEKTDKSMEQLASDDEVLKQEYDDEEELDVIGTPNDRISFMELAPAKARQLQRISLRNK